MAEPNPESLAAGERLRRRFPADDVAWALSQVAFRRLGSKKLERAGEMLFTRAGLEQATRQAVARWRAQRFVDAGVQKVWDLGCGIGADAMAFAEAGLEVTAVEADPDTAEIARHNLSLVGGGQVIVGFAEDQQVPDDAAVFLDPARRTAKGRTWNVADFTPPWDFVLGHLASERFVAVKLGPGMPKELIPAGVEACWVGDGPDTVEACLFNRGGRPDTTRAVLLPSGVELATQAQPRELDVRPVGAFVLEPHGAVIRAGLLAEVAPAQDLWLLDRHAAYLSSDEPVDGPLATSFEVLETLDFDVALLRAWVRTNRVGTLEIKLRGIDVDPAKLRAKLKPKGPEAATLILARTPAGARALVVRRV